jgi:FkbM family methyltransferase
MIDFSEIKKTTFLGKTLRVFLKIIPSNFTMTIMEGSIKGKKWIKGSGVNTYWLGTYEKEQQHLFTETIKKDDVFYDIGANVGFYSLIASQKVGGNGRVYAFEPVPENLYYIKKHFELNNCTNTVIISGGVSNQIGVTYFKTGDSPATGFLNTEIGDILIPTFDIDGLVENNKILPPNIIKIDVEGAEFDVLEGAKKTLEKFHPIIFLATHNPEVHRKCLSLLNSLNYKIESMDKMDIDHTSAILAKY